jgi:hypothetical protein
MERRGRGELEVERRRAAGTRTFNTDRGGHGDCRWVRIKGGASRTGGGDFRVRARRRRLDFFSIASLFSAHCKMAREIFCAKRD